MFSEGSQNVSLMSADEIDANVQDEARSIEVANTSAILNAQAIQTKDDEELNQKYN